jgi:hypothetical protein
MAHILTSFDFVLFISFCLICCHFFIIVFFPTQYAIVSWLLLLCRIYFAAVLCVYFSQFVSVNGSLIR